MELIFNLIIFSCVWMLVWFLMFYEQSFLHPLFFFLFLLIGFCVVLFLIYSFYKPRKK